MRIVREFGKVSHEIRLSITARILPCTREALTLKRRIVGNLPPTPNVMHDEATAAIASSNCLSSLDAVNELLAVAYFHERASLC